jgi:hypothetical protein
MSIFSNPAGVARAAAGEYIAALLDLLGDRNPLVVQAELHGAVRELTAGLNTDELSRPEAPGKWSIIQVVEHLADQELVNSFRLRSIVAEDEPPLRGYDQDLWAARLRYGSAGLEPVLEELRVLRERNLRLYRSLSDADLDRVGMHDERGPESARRLRALTAGHDLLHRRQIARIHASFGKPAR